MVQHTQQAHLSFSHLQPRWYWRNWNLVIVLFLVLVYFLYHAFNGQRGFPARRQVLEQRAELQKHLMKLRDKRAILQTKNLSFGGGHAQGKIDSDLLSEMLLRLGMVKKDEFILMQSALLPQASNKSTGF